MARVFAKKNKNFMWKGERGSSQPDESPSLTAHPLEKEKRR
jgi:hypothetical protein